jgi:serine/threonine protein kinase/DNA-directed RNA polymerase subunit RPC12/RpoP
MQPTTLGKYQLLKKIAVGGMAEIWVARSAGISGVEQMCVVKRILPELSTNADFVRMFLDEARIAATLNHPNLVQMYDVGEAAGRPFIAMEFLHGEDVRTLRKALRPQRGRMPVEHALNVVMGVAAGLHYAHEKVGFDGRPLRVVHRDISPHNVFVTHDGAVKILDFGIAVAANRDHATQNGTLKGKIPYMSPEQCLCEPLDRRSDIYSLGVMLHELTTGPRLHKAGSSEYEMMRSILEGPIVLPSQIIPDYPPALEKIVLRCLARNKEDRYPTARHLHTELEAFAREERLAVSSLALSTYMAELFGSRAEAWREALASGRDLLAHIVERQPPATLLADEWSIDEPFDDHGAAPPSPRLATTARPSARRPYGVQLDVRTRTVATTPRTSTATSTAVTARPPSRHDSGDSPTTSKILGAMTATERRIGDIFTLALAGKLNEGFQGEVLARDLAGRVIIDLAGVERITSFGVREWLHMLTEAAPRVSELYFFRCAEPIVNQMSMIRGFSGEGRIVSFYAPYRCDACGKGFTHLFDAEADAEAIRAARPPAQRCPRCGQESSFDDDPASYLAFAAPHAGVPVSAAIRAAHEKLIKAESGFGESIEKTIDAGGTRVTVRCPLDGAVRWKRILDGIEGPLVFDLGAAGGVSPEGAAGFERALRALGSEVPSIRIEGCPSALLLHLTAATPPARAEIASAMIETRCDGCNAPRAALVTQEESSAARRERRSPSAACPRCGAALVFAGAAAMLRRLEHDAPGKITTPPPPSVTPLHTVATQPSPSRVGPPAGPSRRPLGIFGVTIALGLIIGTGVARYRRLETAPGAAPTSSALVAPVASAAPPSASEPAWTRQELVIEAGAVLALGGGAGATEEDALAAARNAALDRIALAVLGELAGSELHRLVLARLGGSLATERRPAVLAAEATRYLRQVGSFATPERVEALVQRGPASVTVLARYRLRKEDFDAAVASYRKTGTALGLTVGRVFPLLDRTRLPDVDLIVITVAPTGPAAAVGVRQGELVVALNGRLVPGVDAFVAAASSADDRPIELQIESDGARRTVKLTGR